jgi:hypothetical protein
MTDVARDLISAAIQSGGKLYPASDDGVAHTGLLSTGSRKLRAAISRHEAEILTVLRDRENRPPACPSMIFQLVQAHARIGYPKATAQDIVLSDFGYVSMQNFVSAHARQIAVQLNGLSIGSGSRAAKLRDMTREFLSLVELFGVGCGPDGHRCFGLLPWLFVNTGAGESLNELGTDYAIVEKHDDNAVRRSRALPEQSRAYPWFFDQQLEWPGAQS